MNEFSIIKKYFGPLTQGRAEAANLENDAAALNIPKGYELVVSSDTLVAGVHFLKSETPGNIAHKALRVNLSDLAAVGAKPYCYQLCISFPAKPPAAWLKAFTGALQKDQKKFGIFCSGGDTTRTPGPLSITITIFGIVPKGKSLTRSGARPGDALVITGSVGDACIGLKILQRKIRQKSESCVHAYRVPTPRTAVATTIRTHARAAIDISDGLLADAGHIARASMCSLEIDLASIRFSPAAQKFIRAGIVTATDLLTGGDDYELALAVPPKKLAALLKKLSAKRLRSQVIGRFVAGKPSIRLYGKDGRLERIKNLGWTHF